MLHDRYLLQQNIQAETFPFWSPLPAYHVCPVIRVAVIFILSLGVWGRKFETRSQCFFSRPLKRERKTGKVKFLLEEKLWQLSWVSCVICWSNCGSNCWVLTFQPSQNSDVKWPMIYRNQSQNLSTASSRNPCCWKLEIKRTMPSSLAFR